jgi:hypothetical protein
MFTCSNMFFIMILLLIGSVPLKAMILVFYARFSYRMFVLFGVKHVILCKLSSEFAMTTWSSANNMVFSFVSFVIFISVV